MNTACQVAKETQVNMHIGRIREGLDVLEKSTSELESRISGILLSPPPTEVVNDKPGMALVPLAEVLKIIADRVFGLIENVQAIKTRVEL